MHYLENVSNLITITLLSVLLVLVLIDNILIFIVKQRKPLLHNKYYEFHYKYGLIKISLVKFAIALYIIYALLAPTGSSGALAAPIWAYGYFIAKLIIDLIRRDKGGQKGT